MSTTVLILLILLIVYVPLWFIVWKKPHILGQAFEKYGPTIKINTKYGLRFIERFGRYERFWHIMGNLGQAIAFVLMVMMIYIMVVAVINLPTTLSSGGVGIEYALALPGLNPLLPFWFGLLGLIVAMVCHEMAHGLESRANHIGVKHTGVLYAVVPLGAFVEPDQADVEKASRRAKIDLYTAGIATNFVLAAVSFLIFSTVMLGGISSPYGDSCAVYQETDDSPAYDVDIPAGAIILDVNGTEFSYTEDYYTSAQYGFLPGDVVDVHYRTEHSENTVSMVWGVFVTGTVDGSPADGILDDCVFNSVQVNHGTTYYLYTAQAFSSFMDDLTSGGDVLTVNYSKYSSGTLVSGTYDFTLEKNGDKGYLGVYSTTSGMNLITPDRMLEVATNPLYGADSLLEYPTALLSYVAHPVSGFDPLPESVHWWYGDQCWGFWGVCQAFYWIFWINLMLGITNALPAIPFDGGFVFNGWVDTALEKAGVKDKKAREEKAFAITKNISTLMLFLYMLVIIAAIM